MRQRAPRPGVLLAGLLGPLVGGLLAGCGTASHAAPFATPAASPAGRERQVARQTSLDGFQSVRQVADVALPVRLRIPAIGVDSGLERLGVAADGTIGVPHVPAEAGWFTGGPRPGQDGPAVLLGHVDSGGGAAVFYRLHELRPGDLIDVARADGSAARFRVTGSASFPKDRFPTQSVYYPSLRPELRLITCGGTFDPRTGHYRDNLVVFASLA